MVKQEKKYQSGMSLLLTTLLIACLMGLVLFVMLMVALLETRRSVGMLGSHQAFYAAEGAFHETVLQLKSAYSPHLTPQQLIDSLPAIGKLKAVKLDRTLELDANQLRVDIQSRAKGANRRLVSSITLPSSTQVTVERPPLDIVLVLDVSGSMGWELDGERAINNLKEAVLNFIQSPLIQDEDRISIVKFSDSSNTGKVFPAAATQAFAPIKPALAANTLTPVVQNLVAKGGTNTAKGIRIGLEQLTHDFTSGVDKIMIVFSDGNPNRHVGESPNFEEIKPSADVCNGCDLIDPFSSYQPRDETGTLIGTKCTDATFLVANQTKAMGVKIFSIFFSTVFKKGYTDGNGNPVQNYYCNEEQGVRVDQLHEVELMGESLMKGIADDGRFYQANFSNELTNIFQDIIQDIAVPGTFQYEERAPQ